MKYRDIGTFLLKDDTGAVVKTIQDIARDNPVVAVRMIYERWLEEDEDHSWKKLAKCFKDVQLNPLASDIEQHFGLPSSSIDQSMLIVHARLHATENILFLTAGAQAQPSHQERKKNFDEKGAGVNTLKVYIVTFNNSLLYFQKPRSPIKRHRNNQLHKEKDLPVVLLWNPQDIQVFVRVYLLFGCRYTSGKIISLK